MRSADGVAELPRLHRAFSLSGFGREGTQPRGSAGDADEHGEILESSAPTHCRPTPYASGSGSGSMATKEKSRFAQAAIHTPH